MRKIRLTVAAIMLSVCVLPCLTGCTSSKDTLYVLSFKPEYKEFFDYVNDLYLSENPGIKKINYQAVDLNSFTSVFDSRVQSNRLDVFTTEVSYMMQGIDSYMRELPEKDYYADIDPEMLTLGKYYDPANGGEPKQLTQVYEQVGNIVYYNKDLFDKYDKSEPKTWDEFIALCEFFNSGDLPDVHSPIVFGGLSQWPAMTIMNSVAADTIDLSNPTFFDDLADYDTDTSLRFNNADWVETFEKVKKLGSYIASPMFGMSYDYAPSYFSNGLDGRKFPMMLDGTWIYTQIDCDFTLGYFVLPAENETENADGKKNFATKPGTSFSIFKDTQKAEAAEKYLDLLFREDVYAKFLETTRMASVMTNIPQTDTFINSVFDTDKYTYVSSYDSRLPRNMPIVAAATLIDLMNKSGSASAKSVADDLQSLVNAKKQDWMKYVNLSHTK